MKQQVRKCTTKLLSIVTLILVAGIGTGQATTTLTTTTHNATDAPKTVVDNDTTYSTIIVTDPPGTINDVNVHIDISHAWDQDLDIFLIAPDGTRIELSTDNGGTDDNYTGTIFDDEATTPITAGTAPFTGPYQPEEALSLLDGLAATGYWTLEITDDEALIDGTLNSWSLVIETMLIVDSSYTVSTYVGGLSTPPAGLTVDPATRTLYFAEFGCNGQLQKVAPDGTVTLVTSDFTPNGDDACTGQFYPYISTDIQFFAGNVYVPLAKAPASPTDPIEGELVRVDTATGVTTVEHTFADFYIEGGITVKNGRLLVTSGQGPATEIQSYNTNTQTASPALDVSPLPMVFSVEYDRIQNATYFWSAGPFYRADLDAGTYSAIPSYMTGWDDFVVSPDGNYLIATNYPNIDFVSVTDGSSTTLYNGLTVNSRHDMVLADSSAGGGCSLYIVDGFNILEIAGFSNCKPFPWPMFLPAISNHQSP